jgi:nicotinate dehydrogenase subunit B
MKLTVNGSEHEATVPLGTPLLYPILTMAEIPELKVVIAGNTEASIYGQGSESANALAAPAIAAALFDATGKPARRIPLRPDYVKAMLAS